MTTEAVGTSHESGRFKEEATQGKKIIRVNMSWYMPICYEIHPSLAYQSPPITGRH